MPGLPVFKQLNGQKLLSLTAILEIMDKLKGAKYFTKLDVCWGYNKIQITKGDEWKVAFKMNKGLFEPTVMFFRMCNSLATFQAMMDNIFMTMIKNWLVIVYMDDILIFADTKEELERITKLVLEKLREHDLFLKAKKCKFCQTRIEYLGMIIEEGKISMDAVKLGGIRDWPVPTTLKQTRSFLGFGNFYQKFIFHYSELAQPLNDLRKKDKKSEWNTKFQEAFDTIKKRFTEELVLLINQNHSKSSLMHQKWQQVWYLPNWIQMAIDILSLSCQRLFLKPKESMKSMIKNYWVLFER
jgi:hypothetical protein